MSELILTEEEKAMSIMDTPDKPLADAVRHCYALMHTVAEKLDKPVLAVAAQHMCVFLAKETNAGSLTYTIEGLTCRDDELGNWSIEIKRLSPLPPPPSSEPAPQDTGGATASKKSECGWVPLQEVLDVLYHPNFYWGLGGLSDVKYLDLRIDTRDNHCQVKNRNGKPVNLEDVRSCIAKAWMKGMNENAPLAGRDLSQVVVLDKSVVEEVKGALNAGIQAAMHCTLNATYHMRVMNEAIINLEKAQALASLNAGDKA